MTMQYITRQPRALTPIETRLLRTIAAAGNWLPEPKCQTFDEQEAIHFLWKSGYIEMASFGGWKIKAGSVKPASADTVRALLAQHGIEVGEIKPCKDARARGANSWAFVLPSGVKLGAAWGEFASVYVDQRVCVVELK